MLSSLVLPEFRPVRTPTPHTPLPRRPPRITRRTRRPSRKIVSRSSPRRLRGLRWRRRSSGPTNRGPSWPAAEARRAEPLSIRPLAL